MQSDRAKYAGRWGQICRQVPRWFENVLIDELGRNVQGRRGQICRQMEANMQAGGDNFAISVVGVNLLSVVCQILKSNLLAGREAKYVVHRGTKCRQMRGK